MTQPIANESLASHTTFRVGGPARFFAEAKDIEDLKEAVTLAQKEKLPIFILGAGSNVLVSDSGFNGVVVKILIAGIEFLEPDVLVAGAGEVWDKVVAIAVSKNFAGIENLSWIPGSVGAAPVQDIGAYGTEVREVIEWVEVFDQKSMEVRILSNAQCKFGYRNSIFKTDEGKNFIVTRVALRLKKDGKPNISYNDLANYFIDNPQPTIGEVREAVIEIRKKKLPDITKVGTAGSFFKNPVITETKYKELEKEFPGMPSFPVKPGFKKVPLAWILDKVCKLKGFKMGHVGLHENQPLALVHFGNGTAHEIKELSEKVFNDVKSKTGIEIEWEVVAVGKF